MWHFYVTINLGIILYNAKQLGLLIQAY